VPWLNLKPQISGSSKPTKLSPTHDRFSLLSPLSLQRPSLQDHLWTPTLDGQNYNRLHLQTRQLSYVNQLIENCNALNSPKCNTCPAPERYETTRSLGHPGKLCTGTSFLSHKWTSTLYTTDVNARCWEVLIRSLVPASGRPKREPRPRYNMVDIDSCREGDLSISASSAWQLPLSRANQ
jgi:hypothetical protein